jgi:L-aminopeptidase/D-esterase-like protein
LNDINGFHVRKEHVFAALDGARPGPVAEGNVGGGTGMICHEFKGGIGTASRVLPAERGGSTVGVLVQCNYGLRRQLTIAGVPVGLEITDLRPCLAVAEPPTRPWLRSEPRCDAPSNTGSRSTERGSIIVVVATDAPLLPHQLKRVAKRVALGIGRMGGIGGNSSGDIFLAFSTANRQAFAVEGVSSVQMLPNDRINPVFEATVEATEEAIVNALLAAETMTGADGYRVWALPHERLVGVLRRYGRR